LPCCLDHFSILNLCDRIINHLLKFAGAIAISPNNKYSRVILCILEGDRLNYHFLNFAGGDRNLTHQQIFLNDLKYFRRRSPTISPNSTIFAYLISTKN
jgi:hypothetical protein